VRLSTIRPAVLLVCSALATAAPAAAQRPQVPTGPQAEQMRVQLSVMERLLERAVNEGIVATRAHMPEMVSVPLMLDGSNRARGFKVEGYGVFFDVEVPGLPPSMTWSLRIIARNNDAAILRDLSDLRALVTRSVTDEKARAEVQNRIVRLQQRIVGVPPEIGGAAQPGQTVRAVSGVDSVGLPAEVDTREPDEIYTVEVKNALVNAILNQGTAIPMAPDETLTVAARGSDASHSSGLGDPQVATMYLTIKGQDLAALRAGQINRDEARKRIKENHF
jgi:hypothetical protein